MPETSMDLKLQIEKTKAKAQTLASPKVPIVDLARECLKHWTPEEAIIAVAIAGAESGYRLRARNYANNHTNDYGVFQINEIHNPDLDQIYNLDYNVSRAANVYRGRKSRDSIGWTAWVAYKNQKHVQFLDRARTAVEEALGRP